MNRFYCPHTDFSPPKITIHDSNEIHHLKNVLKMNTGDKLEIFNGQGDEVLGVIESLAATAVRVRVVSRRKVPATTGVRIILACAIPKKSKFEFIIEKATELGVDEIIPLETERGEVIITGERAQRKNVRYQTVAVNAAKQSARLMIPVIHPMRPLKDVIAEAGDQTLKLIPCLVGERKHLRDVLKSSSSLQSILFLIGPEGDFTSKEVEMALKAGFIPVSLGETTLKVDTAAITVVGLARLML